MLRATKEVMAAAKRLKRKRRRSRRRLDDGDDGDRVRERRRRRKGGVGNGDYDERWRWPRMSSPARVKVITVKHTRARVEIAHTGAELRVRDWCLSHFSIRPVLRCTLDLSRPLGSPREATTKDTASLRDSRTPKTRDGRSPRWQREACGEKDNWNDNCRNWMFTISPIRFEDNHRAWAACG